MNKEDLILDIESGLSSYKLSAKYNKSQTSIRYWLKKYNLKTIHLNTTKIKSICVHCGSSCIHKNATKFCSLICQTQYRNKKNIDKWKSGELIGYSGQNKLLKAFIRRYLIDKHEYKCCKCGWGEIHPILKKPPLQINHIDGDAENCNEENLEVLCPNCHSLTHNFGNIGARKSKRNRK
jgi:5-methylcytosine-specific restriction endonuclease McrA